jgi:uncharacterized membrane protein YgcG
MLFSTGCSKETSKQNLQSNSIWQATLENGYAVDVIDATKEFYVNDFASILSEEQRQELNNKAMTFENENNGIEVVITTIPSLAEVYQDKSGDSESSKTVSSMTMERYAYSMYLEYGIGSDDMGILILFSEGDREVYMATGRNMQFYITDGIAGRLIDDYALNDFKQNNFAEGLIKLQNGTFEKIKEVVPVDNSDVSKEDTQGVKSNMELVFGIMLGLFVLVIAFFIIYIRKIQKRFENRYDEMEKSKEATREKLEKQLTDSKVFYESEVRGFEQEVEFLKNERKKALDAQAEEFRVTIGDQKNAYEEKLNSKEQQIKALESKLSNFQQKDQAMLEQINTIEAEAKKLSERFTIAKRVHPELDDEIKAKIIDDQKEAAKKIDDLLKVSFNLQEEYENIPKFEEAITTIKSTDEMVSRYMEYSVSDFESKIQIAKENKYKADADVLDAELNKLLTLPVIPENVSVLINGLQLHSNASAEVIKYSKFNIENLRLHYKQALEQKNEQEAIEFDKKLAPYEKLKPERENIAKLQEAEQILSSIPVEVMRYMKTHAEEITENLDMAKKSQEEYEVECDKAKASEVEVLLHDSYIRCSNCRAEDNEILNSVYEAYTGLTDSQKQYVSKDVLYSYKQAMQKSEQEKQYCKAAKSAEEKAESEIRSIGYSADADDISKIKRALGFYKNLSSSEQKYFSEELLSKIKKMKRQAEDDEEDRKRRMRRKEEERRRSMIYSNSSAHHVSNSGFSSTSHINHGGRPSGGGAGRKF